MKMRKIIAAVAAAAMSISMLAISASAEKKDSYTAVLCVSAGSNQQWKSGELAGSTDATITGNGTYTVTAKMAAATGSIELILISTDIDVYAYGDGSGLAGSGLGLTVDSVKVDGTAINYTGPSDGAFTTNDDGTTLRMNILNTWGNSVSDIASTTVENEISVTFTISGLDTDAEQPTEDSTSDESSTDSSSESSTDSSSDNTASSSSDNTSSSANTGSSNNTSSTPSTTGAKAGDAGVAVAVAGLALAGAAAFAARKKH